LQDAFDIIFSKERHDRERERVNRNYGSTSVLGNALNNILFYADIYISQKVKSMHSTIKVYNLLNMGIKTVLNLNSFKKINKQDQEQDTSTPPPSPANTSPILSTTLSSLSPKETSETSQPIVKRRRIANPFQNESNSSLVVEKNASLIAAKEIEQENLIEQAKEELEKAEDFLETSEILQLEQSLKDELASERKTDRDEETKESDEIEETEETGSDDNGDGDDRDDGNEGTEETGSDDKEEEETEGTSGDNGDKDNDGNDEEKDDNKDEETSDDDDSGNEDDVKIHPLTLVY